MLINQNNYTNTNMLVDANTPVAGTLHVNAEHSNLDYYYGPYLLEENQTVEQFFEDFVAKTEGNTTSSCFLPGFTLGIIPYGKTDVTEYWYLGPEMGWVKKLVESSGNPVAIVDHPYIGGWRTGADNAATNYPEIDGGLTDWMPLSNGKWSIYNVQPGTSLGDANSGRLYANNTYIGQICIKIKSSDVGTGKVLPTLFTDGNAGEIITVSEPIVTTEDSVEYSTYWLTFLYTAPKDLIFSYRFRMNEDSQDEIVNNHSVSNYLFPPGKDIKVGHAFWGNLTAGKTSFINLSHRNKTCFRNLTNNYRCVCIGRIIRPLGLSSGLPGHMFINVLLNRKGLAAPQLYLFSWSQNFINENGKYRLNGYLTKIGNSFNDSSTPSFSKSINKISLYAVIGSGLELEHSNLTAYPDGAIVEFTNRHDYWDLYCELEADSNTLWKSLLVTSSSIDYVPLEELEGTQFELDKQEGVNATLYTSFEAVKTSKELGKEIDYSIGNTNSTDLITPKNYYKFPSQTLVTEADLPNKTSLLGYDSTESDLPTEITSISTKVSDNYSLTEVLDQTIKKSWLFGPYESLEAAKSATAGLIHDGEHIGVKYAALDKVTEYAWSETAQEFEILSGLNYPKIYYLKVAKNPEQITADNSWVKIASLTSKEHNLLAGSIWFLFNKEYPNPSSEFSTIAHLHYGGVGSQNHLVRLSVMRRPELWRVKETRISDNMFSAEVYFKLGALVKNGDISYALVVLANSESNIYKGHYENSKWTSDSFDHILDAAMTWEVADSLTFSAEPTSDTENNILVHQAELFYGYYGPYESVEKAKAATSEVQSDGLKVGVYAEEIPEQLSGLSEEGLNYLLNASDSSLTDEEKALKYLNKFRLLWSSEENFNEILIAHTDKEDDPTITYEYELYPGKTIDLLDVLYFDSTSETYYLDIIALRENITITIGSVSLNITGWYMLQSENFDGTNHEFTTSTGVVDNEIDCIVTAKTEKNWPGSYLNPTASKIGIIDYIWLNNNLLLQSNLRIDESGNYHLRINGFEKSDLTWRSCPWSLGYSQNGRNYPVKDSNGKLYVSIPETGSGSGSSPDSWTLQNTDSCTVESSYQTCSNDTIYGIFKNEKDDTERSIPILQVDSDQFFVNSSDPASLELNIAHAGNYTATDPQYPIRASSDGLYAVGKRYTAGAGISISGWTVATKLTHSSNTGKTNYLAYWTTDNNIKDLAFASYASSGLGSSFKYENEEVTEDDTSHGINIAGSLRISSGVQCEFLGVTDSGYFNDCYSQYLKVYKNVEVGDASSDTSHGNIYATRFFEWSDKRLKTNIVDAEIHLDDIETIPVVNFEFKNSPNKIEIGTLAQDIKDLFPEVVTKKGDYYSVDYSKLSIVAIAGIKLLKKELDELKAKVSYLESKQNER